MADLRERMYVIGDKEAGVLLVTLDPLRASLIPASEVKAYAARREPMSENAAFAEVAAAVFKLIAVSDGKVDARDMPGAPAQFQAQIEHGAVISEAEFCFIADLVDTDWKTKRINHPPLEYALRHLVTKVQNIDAVTAEVGLKGYGDLDDGN